MDAFYITDGLTLLMAGSRPTGASEPISKRRQQLKLAGKLSDGQDVDRVN